MILADKDILDRIDKGDIRVDPLERKYVRSAALDLRLHSQFRIFPNNETTHIDVKKQFDVTKLVSAENDFFVIHPGQFVLAATFEKLHIPNDLAGLLEGRSSLARIGLVVHATAALIPPGFDGHITYEMTNLSNLPIKLYVGMRMAQIIFVQTSQPVMTDYGQDKMSKYQNQEPPTASMIWKDFESDEVEVVRSG